MIKLSWTLGSLYIHLPKVTAPSHRLKDGLLRALPQALSPADPVLCTHKKARISFGILVQMKDLTFTLVVYSSKQLSHLQKNLQS